MDTTLRAAGMRGFEALVEARGVNPRALLAQVGIATSALTDEEERIPLTAYSQLLEAAATATGYTDLGLRMAEAQDITILGPLAIAMQNAATIGEALDLCSRYLHTHSPGIRLSVHALVDEDDATATDRAADAVALRVSLVLPSWWGHRQAMDQCMADLHHFTSVLSGDAATFQQALRAVTLPHAPVADTARYQDVFGQPVIFSAPQAQLIVPRDFLNRSLAGASEQLHRLSIDYLQLAYMPAQASARERVEDVLRRALSSTRGRRDVVARLLGMHPRTLQRRLADEGVTFQNLVDQARAEQARHWLTASALPLAQVAAVLGLADQTVLNRNCRRWFGCTPLQLRQGRASA